MSTFNTNQFALEFDTESPKKIIERALEEFGNIAISFSGAEDVVLVEIASKVIKDKSQLQVFSLDTGRLHPETYQFIETVRKHYGIQIDIVSPEHRGLEAFVKQKGLFSFFEDGHQECCGVRKVAPLRRKLSTLDAWITGQRRDQSPGTRNSVPIAEMDKAFGTEESPLVKFNPLANWSSQQVWEYIRMFDVPYNPLHERGFTSIGCEPCTRPVLPNQHEREGRWWWEEATHKECGLHAGNLEK
ncbi:phosphoadenylyl-sulfate reductase [Oceanospirillum linum]|uniref:Adenosine 5'-phosphosulfate reductase n=1 Tax=Oceanospirillum linum TaxID=966 RepID=A0A1T1H933_OCELI|nr:phosphoadenylyl-sulfate reductase [Oceanospirillum linum]OOV86361.1 phosphoadenosine phosphosulfate reductase [Oceanospirillum linum]SEG48457.1 phosphoadenylylsulfate reductase (thioredoxin) [Oleiphilus messinensis]SMP31237.1 phosphoadenylylsulfate reductase (thioredoxin) [Oceanospirillum linum]